MQKHILIAFLFIALNIQSLLVYAQTPSRENILLREEVSNLRKELTQQRNLTSTLLEKTNSLTNSQNRIITDLMDATIIIQDLSTLTMSLISQQSTYKDAFIFNRHGKPVAFIDIGLKIYGYNNGNFIGWINQNTNEIVRNFDNSVVAIIENDFLIDEKGYPVGSIERSETLKWDREKLYGKVQKTPHSHFFVRPTTPRRFIISRFRGSSWSTQELEDVLFFNEKEIQKVK